MRNLAYQLSALVAVCGLLSFAGSELSAATAEKPQIGHKVPSFTLKDFGGREFSLDSLADKQAVVVAFLGVECPLVKLYATRLEELAKRFSSQGVAFLAIDSNCQDSLAEMEHFARTHDMTIPFLKDVGNVVADEFQALRTPEVFVLDRGRVVRYRGRIDDQYGFQAGVGYQRPEAVEHDLADALDDVLAGREVQIATTPTPGCLIGRAQSTDDASPVTYANQISRIFQNRCQSCHREGEIGPFAMSSYDEVVGWAPMIGEVVSEGRMPPWHASPEYGKFANDARLSEIELEQILTWVEHGAPLGDVSDLPESREYTVGWQIPQPDQIVPMSDEPFVVPATGKVEYQYFLADPKFTEDKWVQACECRPGNRGVVHHIIVFVVPPGEEPKRMAEGK
ncbi:MAG: redoxin domain-containing protein, partial [Pirellulales bacterium]